MPAATTISLALDRQDLSGLEAPSVPRLRAWEAGCSFLRWRNPQTSALQFGVLSRRQGLSFYVPLKSLFLLFSLCHFFLPAMKKPLLCLRVGFGKPLSLSKKSCLFLEFSLFMEEHTFWIPKQESLFWFFFFIFESLSHPFPGDIYRGKKGSALNEGGVKGVRWGEICKLQRERNIVKHLKHTTLNNAIHF